MDKKKTVKVKMKKDFKASPDGINVKDYKEGEEHEVSEKLAKDLQSHDAVEMLKAEEGDKYVHNQKVEGTEHEGGDDSLVNNEPLGEKNMEAEGKAEKAMSTKAIKGAPKNKGAKKEEEEEGV